MNIYTDKGNFHSLKVLVASNLKDVQLFSHEVKGGKDVPTSASVSTLPVLEVEPGRFLTSPNAACKLLMGDESLEVDSWLEWESSVLKPTLTPLLISLIGNGRLDSKLVASLKQLLSELNTALNNKSGLNNKEVSAADIVVWSALFPVLCDKTAPIYKEFDSFTNITQWFSQYAQHEAFRKAVTSVTGDKGPAAFKASLLSQPVPLPLITKKAQSVVSQPVQESESTDKEKALSPEEVSAAVTAWLTGRSKLPAPVERVHPILPKEGDKNILITSALPYVNNVPHLGNIIGCVLSADVFSRFCRLRNYNVLYVCGTDEYGTATETKALEEGITPQQICDKYNALHTQIYDWFNIGFDYFGRTSTPQQTKISQDIFWSLYNKGRILKDQVEQLLCEKCNRFLADRFVEGTCPFCSYEDARGDQCDKCGRLINAPELRDPKCKVCRTTPVVKTSQHLFLDLPNLEPDLVKFLDTTCDQGLWTANAKLITKSWVRDGLKPRCITRDLKWGTPVPLEGYTDKVFYVWFDAPIGYLSITANYTPEWEKWWKNPQQVELYNFMAKDNVPFHSVVFPCTLLGTEDNFTLVNHLVATEYLNYEDGKFSKSRGVGVFGNNAEETGIPADVWRFYLLYVRPETQDSAFNWDDFATKNNSELLNNLGNFINRALSFLEKNFDGKMPEIVLEDDDKELIAYVNRELQAYIESVGKAKLRDGIRNILAISKLGNQYIQAHKPWVLVKGDASQKLRAGTVIGLSANLSCLLSVLLQPYMPVTSQTIQNQLNAPSSCNILSEHFTCHIPAGHIIGKPTPLFQKIESSFAEEMKKKYAGTQSERKEKQKAAATPVDSVSANPEDAARLTAEVTKQGELVRQLKTDKAEKGTIDEAVKKLLDLKKQLSLAEGKKPEEGGKKKGKGKEQPKKANPPAQSQPTGPVNQQEVNRLTAEVAKQGDAVRKLKTEKAEKAKIDAAVAILLDLKKQLCIAEGKPAETKKGKKK